MPSDLDIVVVSKDLPRLEKMLTEATSAWLVQLLQHERTCYYFVLAVPDGDKVRFLPVDAATDYRRDGRIWFTAEELLEGRRKWNSFWVAAPKVEFKYLLVKKILKQGLPQHAQVRLQELADSLGPLADRDVQCLLGQRWGKRVIKWIRDGNWLELEADLPRLKKVLKWERLKREPLNALRYWLPEFARLWRRWQHPTGLFVAVLGPDGAGKSTLIESLSKEVAGAFRRKAQFHLAPALLRRQGDGGPVTDPHGKPPRSWFASLLKLGYYWLDYTLGYWLKIRPLLVRSALVLFDRYYDDLLIDPKRYRYGGPMWAARLLSWLTPRPDLFLVLNVPREQLMMRKQEVSPEELERQVRAYREFAANTPNAFLLDGSTPIEKVVAQARDAILEYLQVRYLSHRTVWFQDSKRDVPGYLAKALKAKQEIGDRYIYLPLSDGRGYLLPAKSRKAAIEGLSMYTPQKARAKAAKVFLSIGLQTGMADRLLPVISLGISGFESVVREMFGRSDFTLAISLGVMGPYGKPVVKVISTNGEPVGYVKIGWNETSCDLVANEFETLSVFKKIPLQHIQFPDIVDFRQWDGRLILATRHLPIEGGSKPQDFREGHFRCLQEIAQIEVKHEVLSQSVPWKELQERVHFVADLFPPDQIGVLEKALRWARQSLGDQSLAFVWRLGDFSPWHVRVNDQGKVYVIDLENARASWFPGWDIFHFFHQASPDRWLKIHEMVIQSKWALAYFYWLDLEKYIPSLILLYWMDLWSEYAVAWKRYGRLLPNARLWFVKYARYIESIVSDLAKKS
ncbi:MAG: phosphotransferase [Candidatus Methanomethylicaceae archaeon]